MEENKQNEDIKTETAEEEKKDGLRVGIYLVMLFTITYLYEYFYVVKPIKYGEGNNIANISLWVAVAMFFPALCVFFTRLITREGLKGSYLNFDLKKGKYKYYLLAWFAPAVVTLLGMIIYFVCFMGDFSYDMKFMIDTYTKQGISGITPDAARKSAISQAITAVVIGPVINCITCFGEEWGWRGYLLPKLKDRLKTLPLLVVTGIIWGLWHLPLTLMGHNYGMDYEGYPYLGVLAMVIFCFSIGTLFSYVTLKTGSCVPAIIGHGAVNSIASLGIMFTRDGGRLLFGPSPAGLISGIPLFVLAVILIRFMTNNDEKEK
ncbi:MAG: CPBP family intramembrane metalloprotease [Lachnospiraceae bacterium]|nr:CPBP family intramembrane metalloprotease [Lachnospiraceae bacterium]